LAGDWWFGDKTLFFKFRALKQSRLCTASFKEQKEVGCQCYDIEHKEIT
jgi:hypothetical protein